MRYFDGVVSLLSFFGGRIEGIVDIVVIELDHVSVLQGFYGLSDNFFHPESVIVELDLDGGLVVSVVDLEREGVRNGGVAGLESSGGHWILMVKLSLNYNGDRLKYRLN